jgi:hypothetical protein
LNAQRLRRVARVCKRFRAIVLSHAPFWTEVSNRQHPSEVDLCLARSKSAPLLLYVNPDVKDFRRSSKDFLMKLIGHSDRWGSLELDYTYCDDKHWDEVWKTHSLLGKDHRFPNLKSLKIHSPAESEPFEDKELYLVGCHPYNCWSAPVLEEPHFFQCIPDGLVPFTLTRCSVDLDIDNWRVSGDAQKIQ